MDWLLVYYLLVGVVLKDEFLSRSHHFCDGPTRVSLLAVQHFLRTHVHELLRECLFEQHGLASTPVWSQHQGRRVVIFAHFVAIL